MTPKGVITTLGVVSYPLPALTILNLVILPLASVSAVTTPPVPPPPLRVIAGGIK